MNSLLILQDEISSYNVPFFNKLAEQYNLTVAYYQKDKSKSECHFEKVYLDSFSLKTLIYIKGLRKLCKQFDIVCFGANMHNLSYCTLPFLPHKYKLVTWGIGFRCSYDHPYIPTRKHTLLDWVSKQIFVRCDANIVYMEESKKFWEGHGIDMRKMFAAPNTTEVIPIELIPEKKRDLLFVGTLYKGKGLEKLLSSVKEVVFKGYINVRLTIVGDGQCRKELEEYVAENGLKDNVVFTGAIFDEKVLAEYFATSLLCISPTQGGLTCPKSMGYGVPFATRKDAITGGEIYHITSGVNGIMYERDEELTSIIEDACKNPDKYVDMGIAAKDYYEHNATISHMAQGAIDAIEYALNH